METRRSQVDVRRNEQVNKYLDDITFIDPKEDPNKEFEETVGWPVVGYYSNNWVTYNHQEEMTIKAADEENERMLQQMD